MIDADGTMDNLAQDSFGIEQGVWGDIALPLPITSGALAVAAHFAAQYADPQKSEQVRLNTLAVCVVHDYLAMMGLETDIAAGDSWNPMMRLAADTADLVVQNQGHVLGRLECRPLVAPVAGSQFDTCPIPPEVWDDRLGYLVIQLDVPNQQAVILGFAPEAAVEELPLSQLQAPENLFDHLEALQSPAAPVPVWTNLSRWWSAATTEVSTAVAAVEAAIDDTIDASWVAVETLLNPAQPQYAFRYRRTDASQSLQVRRAKRLQLGSYPIALVLSQSLNQPPQPGVTDPVDLRVQVYPIAAQLTLPAGLQLRILEASGEEFARVEARAIDESIQYAFTGEPSERFQVQLRLVVNGQEVIVSEGFQV